MWDLDPVISPLLNFKHISGERKPNAFVVQLVQVLLNLCGLGQNF